MQKNVFSIPFGEKIGYALGDAASNLVWRGALGYLAIFYTDVLGISAAAAALLLLLVRLSDGVTDIIMGMVADRTQTRAGKFRPWILWSAPLLGLFMALSFTAPDISPTAKLVYAYVTYIGLTLAYTMVNVPYSALMGVMTASEAERTSLSGFRFAGAFGGGILITGFLPDLVKYFGQGNEVQGYQYTMFMFSVLLVILLVITYLTTNERVQVVAEKRASFKSELGELVRNLPLLVVPLMAMTAFFYYRNWQAGLIFLVVIAVAYYLIRKFLNGPKDKLSHSQKDMMDLITNKPWLILLGVGFLFMMFNGIKQGVIVYYFKYYVGDQILAGRYFIALLAVSIVAALLTSKIAEWVGKKRLFVLSLVLGGVFTLAIYWIDADNVKTVFALGCISEFFAAIMPVLFFTMLGDSADYSEWKNRRRATGLVYSAGTFINKTGGGFAGAMVLFVLAGYGYNGMDTTTIEAALPGMKLLMSWIPAGFAFGGALLMCIYPLTKETMAQIESDLIDRREAATKSI